MQQWQARVSLTGLMALAGVAVAACGEDNPAGPGGNQAPTAQVTANPTSVPAGDNHQTIVTIDGSASTDPDGDQLTYSWVVPSGQFVGGSSATDATIQVTFPGAAPYTVTLTVSDGNGGSDSDSIVISIQ